MNLKIAYFIYTRLSGRFAPIFFCNCEHFLFVYIEKKIAIKSSRIFKKTFRGFSKFIENRILLEAF